MIPVCPRTQPVCSEVLSHASGICSSVTCEAVTMVRGCRFHMHDDSGLQYLQRILPTGIYNCLDVVSLVMFTCTPGSSIVWIIARCACILVDIQRWVILEMIYQIYQFELILECVVELHFTDFWALWCQKHSLSGLKYYSLILNRWNICRGIL